MNYPDPHKSWKNTQIPITVDTQCLEEELLNKNTVHQQLPQLPSNILTYKFTDPTPTRPDSPTWQRRFCPSTALHQNTWDSTNKHHSSKFPYGGCFLMRPWTASQQNGHTNKNNEDWEASQAALKISQFLITAFTDKSCLLRRMRIHHCQQNNKTYIIWENNPSHFHPYTKNFKLIHLSTQPFFKLHWCRLCPTAPPLILQFFVLTFIKAPACTIYNAPNHN